MAAQDRPPLPYKPLGDMHSYTACAIKENVNLSHLVTYNLSIPLSTQDLSKSSPGSEGLLLKLWDTLEVSDVYQQFASLKAYVQSQHT